MSENTVNKVGRPTKYNFDDLQIGELRAFESQHTDRIINCASSYCKVRNLPWKFKAWKEESQVYIIRIR